VTATDAATGLPTIAPVATSLGAAVSGVDLCGELSDEQVATLRAALLRWKVLFFDAPD
jgi:taurine dioxygenase